MDIKKANAVCNALYCKFAHGLDGTRGWDDEIPFSEKAGCNDCPYCCGEPFDCDITELFEDAANIMGELINENRSLRAKLGIKAGESK